MYINNIITLNDNKKIGKKNGKKEKKLPVLSFQPVIENIIKQNVISENKPLTISIYIDENEMLSVSNPVRLKLGEEKNTGIGLKNLSNRYKLLLAKNIVIEENKNVFTVKLPLAP